MQRLMVVMVLGISMLSGCAEAGPGESALAADPPALPESIEEVASPSASIGEVEAEPSPKPPQEEEAPPAPSEQAGQQKAEEEAQKAPASQPAAVQCSTTSGGGDGVAQLVDVRVGTHDGFDRVVFELAAPEDEQYFGMPLYVVSSLQPPIREDGSGEPIAVEGSHYAGIVFHGASGVEFIADGYRLTYTGPKELKPRFEVLTEAQQTGDFEATLSWAFGLQRPSCWKVLELRDPLRLVIDFPH